MKQSVLLLVLCCLTVGCQRQLNSNKNSIQTEYTDSMPLNIGNYHLKFNSFGLFDTMYNCLRQNMCYPASRFTTYSHSDYLNIDTFFFMHQISAEDSTMYMNIPQEWLKTDRTVDLEFCESEIAKQESFIRAVKSSHKLYFRHLVYYQCIPIFYYAYLRDSPNSEKDASFRAITVVDSTEFSFGFICNGFNAETNLNSFERIFQTMRIYTK